MVAFVLLDLVVRFRIIRKVDNAREAVRQSYSIITNEGLQLRTSCWSAELSTVH